MVAVAGLGASGGWVVEGVRVVAEPPARCAPALRYPVFNIPLDGWSEVELKASTNNFNPGLGGGTNMVYWYESLGRTAYPDWYGCAHADASAQVFYCNPDAADYNARSWILATNTLTLTEQIGGNGNYQDTVVVVPGLTVRDGSTNTWMNPANGNLVWSYRRRTAAYGETNALGHTVWHPVVPSQWRSAPMGVGF